MYDEYVIFAQVRTIKLNHAKSRNSLSLEMLQQLLRDVTRDQHDVRSIVITAEPGKVFSAGHNLKELVSDSPNFFTLYTFITKI